MSDRRIHGTSSERGRGVHLARSASVVTLAVASLLAVAWSAQAGVGLLAYTPGEPARLTDLVTATDDRDASVDVGAAVEGGAETVATAGLVVPDPDRQAGMVAGLAMPGRLLGAP